MIEHHSLANELPEFKEKIHQLKMSDRHFQKLFHEYHDIDKEIVRIEDNIEVASDDALEELKKQRLNLKDQLANMLRAMD